jgi:hypothetical protein
MSNGQSQINANQIGIDQINANRASVKRSQAMKRPPRPTTAKQSPAGLVISFVLHAGLLTATLLTWNRMVTMSPETHAIPVDLVVERQTNVRAEAPPPEPDKPIRDILPEPTLPPLPAAEPGPLPPIPQIKIIQPKTDQNRTDQPKSKKQMVNDADAILNQILAQAKTPKNAKTSDRVIEGAGNQALSSADLVDALRGQIDRCWSPPVGAPNASDLVVDFDLQLNADGTVAGSPQLSGNLAGDNLNNISNPYTRAAAGAAYRAIYQCAPYKLPAKRYAEWQEINPLRFDPRQMMGQ